MPLQHRDPVHLDTLGPSLTDQLCNSAAPIAGDLPIAHFSPGGPLIAVDLDDVLSQTNAAISESLMTPDPGTGHNDNHGSPDEMSISTIYYYYYWKSPFWGTPEVTHSKVREFYKTNWIEHVRPVPGAKEGVETLRQLGYRLVIVTARNKNVEHASWEWAKRHFGDAFECIICTGQFASAQQAVVDGVYKNLNPNGEHSLATKSSKAQVCIDIGAKLLIDDSVENAMACVTYEAPPGVEDVPPKVLLFGEYEWGKRLSRRSTDERDEMTYANRVDAEGGNQFLKQDCMHCEEEMAAVDSKQVERVKGWREVVAYVTAEKAAGRL
ncbi:hypothetical protein V8B97DRAFT_1918793 [Scleroderma yunnanense]